MKTNYCSRKSWCASRVIDRASKRGSGSGSSTSLEMCIAGRPVSDRTFFLACLGVFAAGSLASWGRVYALAMATAGVAEKLRTQLFASLMLQEKEFFDEKRAGELAPVLTEVRSWFVSKRGGRVVTSYAPKLTSGALSPGGVQVFTCSAVSGVE